MDRKSCFGVMSAFSQRWLHLELLSDSARGENDKLLDAVITSPGSKASEVAVAQIDSSKASQDAAPEMTVLCGVPNGELDTGFNKEITASTEPSISKGLKT